MRSSLQQEDKKRVNTVANQTNMPKPELVRPLYFRAGDKYLFGCYHLPAITEEIRGAVLVCPASGYEYYCSHRGVRQLAAKLAKSGFHVLRFDYFGSGDSAGSDESATVSQWMQDIDDALDEIKRLSHCDKVSVIGLRLGATIATQTINKRNDIDRVVLWNPIYSGTELIQQWSAIQSQHNDSLGVKADTAQLTEVLGIELSPVLLDELQELKLLPVDIKETEAMVLSNQGTELANTYVADMTNKGINARLNVIEDHDVWLQSDEGIVPSASVNQIMQWVGVKDD